MKTKNIQIRTNNKEEFIEITQKVQNIIDEAKIEEGICLVYCPHTTAGITINEGADPSVVTDVLNAFNKIVPNDLDYKHLEGNSPSHIRSILTGNNVSIIVEEGKLVLGTWQSIFFCEYDGPRDRSVLVKLISKS
ncbi:YjbQ family protein [archaeon]|jgi:secondary thiamine-phosphate synthase enzyme|nr:YjbQ family protein [archaeon]MBT4352451.1 YjbQ family protein [archaeon]MBT4647996.1 YjbQ family protein [archaeon]MBT6820912.1 YjbQ family protein [archaeon]MBT7392320.1 YjbQ family protein [archaeon]